MKILCRLIRHAEYKLYYNKHISAAERGTWARILLGAMDQLIRATTGEETDRESLAELLYKLPKRVLKRIEREVCFEVGVRRVVKAESK